jgi:hypothetical protein
MPVLVALYPESRTLNAGGLCPTPGLFPLCYFLSFLPKKKNRSLTFSLSQKIQVSSLFSIPTQPRRDNASHGALWNGYDTTGCMRRNAAGFAVHVSKYLSALSPSRLFLVLIILSTSTDPSIAIHCTSRAHASPTLVDSPYDRLGTVRTAHRCPWTSIRRTPSHKAATNSGRPAALVFAVIQPHHRPHRRHPGHRAPWSKRCVLLHLTLVSLLKLLLNLVATAHPNDSRICARASLHAFSPTMRRPHAMEIAACP